MFIQFFKNNNPASYILLPVFALILWISGFFMEQTAIGVTNMPLYEMITRPIASFPFLNVLLAFLLVVGEAFLLNFIVNENQIVKTSTFIPALMYICYMSNDLEKLTLNPTIFANLFILFAIYKLSSSYRKDVAFSEAFDTGFLFSIAFFFYFPTLILLPLIIVGLILFRPFNWREWVISLLGFLLPFIFVVSYYFWFDKLDVLIYEKFFYSILREQQNAHHGAGYYFMIGSGWFIALLAIINLFNRTTGTSQRTKKGISLMIWIFIFSVLSVSIAPEISTKYLSFLAIPVAVFSANYFIKIKKILWAEFMFIVFILSILANHFF